ncbi:hypothetical protein ACQP3L_35730, partial [Escherichia coli]
IQQVEISFSQVCLGLCQVDKNHGIKPLMILTHKHASLIHPLSFLVLNISCYYYTIKHSLTAKVPESLNISIP